MSIFTPILLSLKLALFSVPILLVVGIPIAYKLAFSRQKYKYVWEAIVSLPLVLPPSVLGFYLLLLFSPQSWVGMTLKNFFGIQLLFSFPVLVIGALIFNFPFMVNSIKAGFESIPRHLIEASYVLGKSPWVTMRKIMLPNMKPALLTGIVLCTAHTLGEFGVVLMIGGNIPGVTRIASLAIYNEVEAMNYGLAHFYALILLGLSFVLLAGLHYFNGRKEVKSDSH